MKIYYAPMEGVTGYVLRNAHNKYFGHIDKYFTPFLTPTRNRKFTFREISDILPEHNRGLTVIPQLLTSRAEDFVWAAGELKNMGYGDVNLNLGCPSGTVTAKKKGAGFLAYPEELDRFLNDIFERSDMRISIKTRIGMETPDEAQRLFEIFRRYPLSEVIIHPRTQRDLYRNKPNLSVYREAAEKALWPVCYNGDLFTAADCRKFAEQFPRTEAVMLGRGLTANPWLSLRVAGKTGAAGETDCRERFRNFHAEIYSEYRDIMSGDRNALFRMKELWGYWSCLFPGSDRMIKKIKKAEKAKEYEAAVERLLDGGDLDVEGTFK